MTVVPALVLPAASVAVTTYVTVIFAVDFPLTVATRREYVPPADAVVALKKVEDGGPAGLIPHLGKYDPPSWKFEFFPRFSGTEEWPPERLAEQAHDWTHAGARIVGVGFGGGPEHVRALVAMRGAAQ